MNLKSRCQEKAFLDKPRPAWPRTSGRMVVGGARVVSGAEKVFDRGGPVWPPRSNAKDDRLGEEFWGGKAPPAKNRRVWGAALPSQKRNVIKKPLLEKALSRKAFNSMVFYRFSEIGIGIIRAANECL